MELLEMSKQNNKSQKDAKEHHCDVSKRFAKMDRQFLADLESMIRENNPKKVLRLIRVMLDVLNNPFEGIGKPEPLKHEQGWSRRVNDYDRLQYSVENDYIQFSTASGHYTRN